MNEPGATARENILEQVFPGLRYGGDPDIERYFDLRAAGKMMEALSVYNARIRPRYPDDAERVLLLKLYRTRSPGFATLLHTLLNRQIDAVIARIIRNIDALIAPLTGVPMKNTYGVLKAVETIARLLPDDADKARNVADTHGDYAKMLNHRHKEMQQVCYLLGEFYDQASVDDNEGRDFIASSLAAEEERKNKEAEREKKNFFDLSRIEFDAADVRRIEIPSSLVRDEDMVLAYCHKYWLVVEDPAFERIVWLYSRKYSTMHYEVFKAIKTGRRKKYSDDDILSLVATTIATRYNYTVQGDLYMQAAWKRIKAALYAAASPVRPPERPPTRTQAPRPGRLSSRRPAPRSASPIERRAVAEKPATPPRDPRLVRVHPVKTEPRIHGTANTADLGVKGRTPRSAPPGTSPVATGSVSDIIKRLSGRSYDVYRDIFLDKARPAIREVLLRQPNRPASLFGEELNEAENLVHEFLERNYTNPFMDWKTSDQYTKMKATGYHLENMEVVIEACYKRLK
ncbi:MAG: hypothetical protein AB7T74_08305 [Clostridia bacterium]|jgi:hypothetical protein